MNNKPTLTEGDIRYKAVEYGTCDLQQIATIDRIIASKLEEGRLSVLQDFDNLCKANAFMGFTDDEFKTIKKFFAFNKQISGWDKPHA